MTVAVVLKHFILFFFLSVLTEAHFIFNLIFIFPIPFSLMLLSNLINSAILMGATKLGCNFRLDSIEQTNRRTYKWEMNERRARLKQHNRKKNSLTIQLISTDSRDPFDFLVFFHHWNCAEEFFGDFFFSMCFLTLSLSLFSFPPFFSFNKTHTHTHSYFNTTKYALNLIQRNKNEDVIIYFIGFE